MYYIIVMWVHLYKYYCLVDRKLYIVFRFVSITYSIFFKKRTMIQKSLKDINVHYNEMTKKKLTEVYIPPSNFFVQPYLGITKNTPNFILQEEEVETLIEVPLIHFMDDTVKIHQNLTTSYAKNIKVPAFLLNDYLVWGATAMMISEIVALLKSVK